MIRRMIKALSLIFAFIILISVFLIPVSAYVAPIINPCDDSYVVDDLTKMGYNTYDYVLDPSANFLQVIHFLEYAYSSTDHRYYSLYLYLYNPSGKKISESGSNIQLCYTGPDGTESKYIKYSLEVVNASKEQGSENILYKLEVKGIKDIANKINSSNRTYNLASVEILYEGESKPVTKTLRSSDDKNRCKWTYTGYQSGFGSATKDGTLRCDVDVLDTIPVELHDASWMSDTSNLGEDYRWEVKSYYFNIPYSYIRKYGDITMSTDDTDGLVAVEGEYYKYGLNGLIVPDQETYNKFLPSVDIYKFPEVSYDEWESFFKLYGRESTGNNVTHTKIYYEFSFNRLLDVDLESGASTTIQYSNKNLLKYNLLSIGSNVSIQSDVFKALWEASGKPVLTNSGHMVMGSNVSNIGDRVDFKVTVEDGDLANSIKTYASKNTWGNLNWLHKLFNKELYTDESGYLDCLPLVQINSIDVSGAFKESVQAKDLYLDYDSYTDLQSFYNDKSLNNNVYLMRLGIEPYYESDVTLSTGNSGHYYEKVIHKDVDIFSFTFKNSKGALQTVPVECDPVDNLGSVVEGNNKDDMNPNKYPEDPTAAEIAFEGAKKLGEFLSSLKGIVILIISAIGIVGILVVIIVFWKYLEPLFVRAGRGLGAVFRGGGKLFGWFLRIILNGFIALWNIGIFIGSIFFAPLSVLRINFIGSSGKSSSSDDSKYYYEDRKYKQSEEKRRQERHDAEMKLLERKSKSSAKSDSYEKEGKALKKAIEKDKSTKAQFSSEKTYDTDEFFQAAVDRTYNEFSNDKKE